MFVISINWKFDNNYKGKDVILSNNYLKGETSQGGQMVRCNFAIPDNSLSVITFKIIDGDIGDFLGVIPNTFPSQNYNYSPDSNQNKKYTFGIDFSRNRWYNGESRNRSTISGLEHESISKNSIIKLEFDFRNLNFKKLLISINNNFIKKQNTNNDYTLLLPNNFNTWYPCICLRDKCSVYEIIKN